MFPVGNGWTRLMRDIYLIIIHILDHTYIETDLLSGDFEGWTRFRKG